MMQADNTNDASAMAAFAPSQTVPPPQPSQSFQPSQSSQPSQPIQPSQPSQPSQPVRAAHPAQPQPQPQPGQQQQQCPTPAPGGAAGSGAGSGAAAIAPLEAPNLPNSLFDVFLDLPHPGASSNAGIRVIYPPNRNNGDTENNNGVVSLLPLEDLASEFGPARGPDPGESQGLAFQGCARIARFCFPEYEDSCNALEASRRTRLLGELGIEAGSSLDSRLNRHDARLEEICAVRGDGNGNGSGSGNGNGNGNTGNGNTGNGAADGDLRRLLPCHHSFAHRLQSLRGSNCPIHGHVRRYLPNLPNGNGDGGRRDAGRRSPRALVLLTRNAGGGGGTYKAMLKAAEALVLLRGQQGGQSYESGQSRSDCDDPLERFLGAAHREHLNACRDEARKSGRPRTVPQPRVISLPLTELGRGHGLFGAQDNVRLALPPSFLREGGGNVQGAAGLSRNDIMPMLRCLGANGTMRLLSALMSERRVILTANDVAKLSKVAYGAVAVLGQGLLPPPPVFVPVLPPGLASLLQTPSSYLIGVLTGPSPNYLNLRNVPNIGEVVLFDLDNQERNEPYCHNIKDPQRAVPDLTRRHDDALDVMGGASIITIADVLYQDLTETLKMDRKVFWQGAVQEKLGLAAAKGKKAASAAYKKGLKYFKKKGSNTGNTGEDSTNDTGGDEDANDEAADFAEGGGAAGLSRLVGKGNYAYLGGFTNVEAEAEARIAFSIFFVSLLGDLRTYLTQQVPGAPPVIDKPKFAKHRAANGDAPGSGMYHLLVNFLSGKTMFDSFVRARLEEVRTRKVVPEDAPLFALVSNHHRLHKIDFELNHVRPSVRRIAADLPGNYLIKWNRSVRARVSELTSAQAYPGDWNAALAQLTEDCRESSAVLVDATMVLWTRLQEGRGMQWKKALLALYIFRHLLLNGPINAIAEAIDGFASFRILKSYTEALRAQNSKLVRDVATEIYALLVDPPVLFARRRDLMNKRRMASDPKPSPLRKETRMAKGVGQFRKIHAALRPPGATVAPAPPLVDDLLFREMPPANTAPRPANYSNDLLAWGVAAAAPPSVAPAPSSDGGGGEQKNPMDVAAAAPPSVAPAPSSSAVAGGQHNDLLALTLAASPSPQAAATVDGGGGEQKNPNRVATMSHMKMPKAEAPPTAKDCLPQPTNDFLGRTFGVAPSAQVDTAAIDMARGDMKKRDPFNMQAMSQAMQKQVTPQTMLHERNTSQPKQALPQPPATLNTTFSMANNFPVLPSQQKHQQQSQTVMKSLIMNQSPMSPPPAHQGMNFPSVYPPSNHSQQQQTWSNMTTAPVQATQPHAGHASYPMVQQGAPPFQQAAVSQLSNLDMRSNNAYGNVQKK